MRSELHTAGRPLITRWLVRLGPLLTCDIDRALVACLGINTVPYREEGRVDERRRLVALYTAVGASSLFADLELPPS